MEYEQALFRVYERCIESLRDEDPRTPQRACSALRICKACEVSLASASVFLLLVLVVLHQQFVGQPGCMPDALQNMLGDEGNFKLQDDQFLQVIIAGSRLYPPVTRENASAAHFEFAVDSTVLQLSDKFRADHDVRSYNVTLEASDCFGSSTMQALLPFGGTRTAVLNFLMYTFDDGAVKDTSTGDFWAWSEKRLYPYNTPGEWLQYKMAVAVHLFFFFMFLSGVTALVVRMLISSGVVVMFPVFACIEQLGWTQNNFRLLALSYPWLGLPLEMLRNNNKPVMPFLLGHVFRVILYYGMYEACQLAWARWFYGENTPSATQSWMYALFMIWEYFSMVYVRSHTAIRVFPRVSACIVIIYQLYYMSFPGGFHSLALWVAFLLLVLSMLLTTRKLEVPALMRGDVSIDQPRALYNELPWPSWQAALPPDWTLMLPVTARSTPVYTNHIPERPGGAGGGGGGGGGGAGEANAEPTLGPASASARSEEQLQLLNHRAQPPEEVKTEHHTTYDSVDDSADLELGRVGIRRGHRYSRLSSES